METSYISTLDCSTMKRSHLRHKRKQLRDNNAFDDVLKIGIWCMCRLVSQSMCSSVCLSVSLCLSLFLCSCLYGLEFLYVPPMSVGGVEYQSRAGYLHAGSAFVPMMSVVVVLASLRVIRMCKDGGEHN